MPPFVVLSLPRSRSAWLSRFLTYGDWVCGHEEIRHLRTLDDAKLWFDQPNIGTAETAAAPWWRLLDQFAPGARVLVVRRPVEDVVDSLMRLPGLTFERDTLLKTMTRLDRKLDQIEARVPNVLSVSFSDLNDEATCAKVFEHCLPLKHDHDHWARLAPVNIQANMFALMRYMIAYAPAVEKMAAMAKRKLLSAMALRRPVEPSGVTFQEENFDSWLKDAKTLIEDHLVVIAEAPDSWKRKNLDLMRNIHDIGAMQIMTARSNGRMFGYLMTLIAPSLTSSELTSATNTAFYASPEFPGLGAKIQRASLAALKKKGVGEVFFEAGQRGSGPRLSVLYKRLGAQEHGQAFRMQLAEI